MENRAPWELELINLYRTTREEYGSLSYGNFWYAVEGDWLYMRGGSSVRWVSLKEVTT